MGEGGLESSRDGVTVSATVVVTDSGGDEDKMKHVAREASTPNFSLLFFALLWLLHLHHCIVKRSLAFADKLCETLSSMMNDLKKYWSTIAKTIHCWRDRRTAVYTEWVHAFGVVGAHIYAKRMPPPISGRWRGYRGQRGATEWISVWTVHHNN